MGEYEVCIAERQVCEVQKQRCVEKLKSEGQGKKVAKKVCKNLRSKCEMRHEVRQQLKQSLKKVDEGHAITASFSVILSGEERRAIEGSVSVVSAKRTPLKQVVKVVVDGEKHEIEIPRETRHTHRAQPVLRINGVQQGQESNQLRSKWTSPLKTKITKFEDGVYSIYSPKYGMEVLADGEILKVKTHHVVFRNKATGLCGNLDGESTSDLHTGRQCILS